MANDRMFIRNKITGKCCLLAKHLGMGWSTPAYDVSKHIDDFFEDHFDEFYKDPRAYEITWEHNRDCTDEKCTCNYMNPI